MHPRPSPLLPRPHLGGDTQPMQPYGPRMSAPGMPSLGQRGGALPRQAQAAAPELGGAGSGAAALPRRGAAQSGGHGARRGWPGPFSARGIHGVRLVDGAGQGAHHAAAWQGSPCPSCLDCPPPAGSPATGAKWAHVGLDAASCNAVSTPRNPTNNLTPTNTIYRLRTLKLHGTSGASLCLDATHQLASLPQLSRLQLVNCTLASNLEGLTQLATLKVMSCNLEGVRRQLMASLAALPALQVRVCCGAWPR